MAQEIKHGADGLDALSIIRNCLDPMAGKRILDVGCGGGKLASTLTSDGGKVTGIDPGPTAIDAARRLEPRAEFHVASAGQLPFAQGSFDAAILSNSLHHIPAELMIPALHEASRVIAAGGHLIVIEPLPKGSFFEAFRAVEDETVVRLAAQRAIGEFTGHGFAERSTIEFVRIEPFNSFEAFIERVTTADKSRLEVIRHKRDEVLRAFEANAASAADAAFVFEQPLKVDIWRK
jgi:ubiquinone/menaquinone biosynthesis C-methylase UbiE